MISLQTKKFTEKTAGHCDIIDITPRIHDATEKTHIHHGLSSTFVSGSLAALTTIEHESGLIQDLKEFGERLIPSDRHYHRGDRVGSNNGLPHPRAAHFGPSIGIPIANGKASLGTWQQVISVDFDNRPPRREIILQLIGAPE